MLPAKAKPLKLPDGTQAYGVEVEFETTREEWNIYTVSDGTRLHIKTNLVRAYRLVDEQGNQLYDPDGEPQFFITTGLLVVAKEKAGG
jgi:hypothetical protein